MAKSRYTFEKREREKAKRQKHMEKLEQRQMAKKAKADSDLVIPAESADATGFSAISHSLVENINNRGPSVTVSENHRSVLGNMPDAEGKES